MSERETAVELRDITMDDLPLYEGMLTDPRMMTELGGPLPREGLEEKLRGIVDDVRAGNIWFHVIVSDGESAGSVCIWDHDWNGQRITEIGWMVRPEFQGRGLASASVREVLERARAELRWEVVHAFPGMTNGPSNAICRKTGFSLVEQVEFEYVGRPMTGNHWVVDLRA